MKKVSFKGTGVALVTPFNEGEIDFPALERIIEHTINGGVDYIVSLGTTGESITLNAEECIEVYRFTKQIAAGRVPLVAGMFGGNNTAQLSKKISAFDFSGYDAILSSSPSFSKPAQEGIFQHFIQLANASPLPIILYNVPGRTASNMTPETIIRLANAHPNIIAVKEASGNIVQGAKIIKEKPEGFLVLSGDDPTALPLISCGADGIISVIANALPDLFSNLIRSALQGDFYSAQKLHLLLLDVHPWLYADGNPAGIKAALEIMGFCNKELRLPLVPVSEDTYLNLKRELKAVLKGIKEMA